MTNEHLLAPDGVATSPLPDYPGQIAFPLVMTLGMHRQWQLVANEPQDSGDTSVGVAFIGDSLTADNRVFFRYGDVRLALLFGKLAVTAPDGRKLTEKTAVDELPVAVAVWIARAYREWEASQLLFRWNGGAGVAASDRSESGSAAMGAGTE